MSQKLRIAQKNYFILKMSVRSIPIYPANLAILMKKIEFLGAQNAPFGRLWHPNAI